MIKIIKKVIEVAEKIPLSSYAIAGLYYFKSSSDFLKLLPKPFIMREIIIISTIFLLL